jgi:hypothetical protein
MSAAARGLIKWVVVPAIVCGLALFLILQTLQKPLSPEERSYTQTIGAEIESLQIAAAQIERIRRDPPADQQAAAAQLQLSASVITVISGEAQQLTPPPRFQDAHAIYLAALGHYERLAELLPAYAAHDRDLAEITLGQAREAYKKAGWNP